MIPELLMFCNIEPYASYYVCITNILFDHLKQYHWITTCVLFVECRYSIQVGYCIACIMKFKNKSEKRKEGYISYERQIIWREIRRGHFVKSHGLKQEIVQSDIYTQSDQKAHHIWYHTDSNFTWTNIDSGQFSIAIQIVEVILK